MAVTIVTTEKRLEKYAKDFLETSYDSMLITEKMVVGDPLRFRTFINHAIRDYDIKGVKAVVRKGHVYLVRVENMA